MSELFDTLRVIDDDYLVGLSNKGTVKRANKDLEGADVRLKLSDDAIVGRIADAECRIVLPLSQSSCSCPSVGMCRHMISIMLAAKKELSGKTEEGREEGPDMCSLVMEEVDRFSEDNIIKKLGSGNVRRFIDRIKDGGVLITKKQMVNVECPAEDFAVKLIHPLEASGCSCHKEGYCSHKLKAILAVKLESKDGTALENIAKKLSEEERKSLDTAAVRQASELLNGKLLNLYLTGLSRISPEAGDDLMRVALICHNAGLPDAENASRELGELLDAYHRRSAAVTVSGILKKTIKLLKLAGALLDLCSKADEGVENNEGLLSLAGEFRSEYLPVKDLELAGLGIRSFRTRSGYAGETVYFLELKSGEWYTYTGARASFYDDRVYRPRANAGNGAPWGLACSLAALSENVVLMRTGKCNSLHRLSSSEETVAEISGSTTSNKERISPFIYTDLLKLWEEHFEIGESTEEFEKLVLFKPNSIEEMVYDKTGQRLNAKLFDEEGRHIELSLGYSREEASAIRSIERMADRLGRRNMKPPVMLGMVYIENAQVRFYPIEAVNGISDTGEAEKKEADFKKDDGEIPALLDIARHYDECLGMLSDIFNGGMSVIPEFLEKKLNELIEGSSQYGMKRLYELLEKISAEINKKRHDAGLSEEEHVKALAGYINETADFLFIASELTGRRLAKKRLRGFSL